MWPTCRWYVVWHDINETFLTDTQKTPTFCCDWHVKLCQCVSTVNKIMSAVSNIASPSDILGRVSENASDKTFHVSNVSDVCQVLGVLLIQTLNWHIQLSLSMWRFYAHMFCTQLLRRSQPYLITLHYKGGHRVSCWQMIGLQFWVELFKMYHNVS